MLGLVVAGCQADHTPHASAATSGNQSGAPFVASTYPVGAPADCSYGGEFAQLKAVDELTVEFDLCYADPAFLAKVAFATNGIQDSDYLAANMANQQILSRPNGTGPLRFEEYRPGDHVTLSRFDGYWGERAKAERLVIDANPDAAGRLLALRTGRVDGIDSPAPADLATIAGDSTVKVLSRQALDTIYIGMSNMYAPFDQEKVRQGLAMGIDRQRIVDTLFLAGSTLADYFTPCSVEFGCDGDPWYSFNKDAANALLDEALGAGQRFSPHIYVPNAPLPYLPDPSAVATELRTQLQENLGITADIVRKEPGAFSDDLAHGLMDGIYLFGSVADYPDPIDFLDPVFNSPANARFGTIDASITSALQIGAQTFVAGPRHAAYAAANNAIRANVPMIPITHAASIIAIKADLAGVQASPFGREDFSAMDPRGRSTLEWVQTGSPNSLYCADQTDGETLRICENVFETLYRYSAGGTTPIPALATKCEPNPEATVWTCTLRSGVTFHDGARLDARDVVETFAVQWDAAHPLHVGLTGRFEYWARLFGAYLNAPSS